MRRLVPALLPFLLAGCPDSHGAPGTDAGPPPSDSAPHTDAPVLPWDGGAGAPDAPSRCPLEPFDALCTSSGNAAVPVGRAFDMEVFLGSIDGCYCGEEIECAGSLAPDGAIDLTAAVCRDLLCDACLPRAVGSCSMPALAAGHYGVRVNGITSFELEASDVSPFVPVDTCTTVPRTGCGPTWPPSPLFVDSACVDAARAGTGSPIPVEVVASCGTCGATPGPCVTEQISPTEFRVVPQEILSSCDLDCPAICGEVRHTCWLPALDAGSYSVRVEGIDVPMTFTVGDPSAGRACVGLLTGGG